jgi:NAD(P)-dependent dehydrogenase (short-subunit alcohol dehydrogenase family)
VAPPFVLSSIESETVLGILKARSMDLCLTDRWVLITGAASGIGRATAQLFASEGCSLLLWDIASHLETVADELRRVHLVSVIAAKVDILDYPSLVGLLEDHMARGNALDHVVHCAATGSGKFGFPYTRLDPSDWYRTMEVNILGMTNVAHAVAPHFVKQARGTFVFLGSIAGQIGSQTDPPYSASKAANINFAQCMAKDLAKHHVRVNTVCPGMVRTPLNQSVWQAWCETVPASERVDYDTWAERKIKALVPLGCWQTCEDVASMIVFLSSDRAGQVTGQTINVDGGTVMHW